MTIKEKIDEIKGYMDYVEGSIFIKSYDDNGCVLKYLILNQSGTADRQQVFLGTIYTDRMKIVFNRSIISDVIVNNPV